MREPKITTTGNRFAAQRFYKEAREQMRELKRSMKPGKLQQNKLEKRPYPGVVISCHSWMGNDTVNIHVDPVLVPIKAGKQEFKILEEFFWYAFNVSRTGSTVYSGGNILLGIGTDSFGNSYVGGGSNLGADSWTTRAPIIIKYDKDGVFQWRKVVNGGSGMDQIQALSYENPAGNIYAGYIQENSLRGDNPDAYVVKYQKDGTLVWQQKLTHSDPTIAIFINGCALDVNVSDSSLTCCAICGMLIHYDACMYRTYLTQFAADGSLNWQRNIGLFVDGDPRDCESGGAWSDGESTTDGLQRIEEPCQLRSCSVDASGDIYGVGHIYGIGSVVPSGLIMKFSSSGTLVWKRAINGFRFQNNELIGVYSKGLYLIDNCIDAEGNIYISGYTQVNSVHRCHSHVFKFDSDGDLLWGKSSSAYMNGAYDVDPAGNIAVSPGGVFVLFPKDNVGGLTYGMTLTKLNPIDGTTIWSRYLRMPEFSIGGSSFSGIRPQGIEVRNNCLHIIADIETTEITVTMKLPSAVIPVGRFQQLDVRVSSDVFSDIEDIEYIEEEEGDGHYFFEIQSVFDLDISAGDLTKSTVTTGDTSTDTWGRTDKIFVKKKEIEVV